MSRKRRSWIKSFTRKDKIEVFVLILRFVLNIILMLIGKKLIIL